MKNFIWILLFSVIVGCNKDGRQAQDSKSEISFDKNNMKGRDGYFRVGKTTDGQWWFIDLDGKPFFYKGICAVNRAGTAGGRRANPGPYATAIDRNFNYQNSPDSFVTHTIDKMKGWGFNAFGAWATEEFYDRGLPYTEILEFFKEGPFIEQTGNSKKIPDIFSQEWKIAIDRKARALCAPKRNSKDLVGYFTDNEIGFGKVDDFGMDPGFVNAGRFGFSLLRETLALDSGQAAYTKAWEFLMGRYSSMEMLSDAWQVPINNKEEIRTLNKNLTPIESDEYVADARDFSKLFASTYFKLVNEVIKKYDPNHLILGCRFGSPPDPFILEAMKPWTDVISQNNYRPVMYERIDYLYEQTDMPIMIGEFSWNTDLFKKVPLHGEEAEQLSVKQRMFDRGNMVLARAATHPGMVGYTWYRWVQPRSTDEKFTDGLVDHENQEDIHSAILKETNLKLDSIRESANNKVSELNNHHASLMLELNDGDFQVFELKIDDGAWNQNLYGWQASGKVNGTINNASAKMDLDVTYHSWQHKDKVFPGGKGAFTVNLKKAARKWEGTYTGIIKGDSVNGRALGYLF